MNFYMKALSDLVTFSFFLLSFFRSMHSFFLLFRSIQPNTRKEKVTKPERTSQIELILIVLRLIAILTLRCGTDN